jgi:enoyl-CoA hydratase
VRVVTQTSQVAMPETGIGLSPDVGGLYLLARSPGEFGTRAALLGARLGPADAIAARLADHFVLRDRLTVMIDRLAAALAPGSGADAAGRVTDGNRQAPDAAGLVLQAVTSVSTSPPPGDWPGSAPWIDACYAGDDAREMLRRLRARPEPAARRDADLLAAMSPTAVAVTLRAIRNAALMPLSDVLEQDLLLCTRFMAHPDFAEGIRAQIVDKDRRPRWRPASLDQVGSGDVDAFFVPLPG